MKPSFPCVVGNGETQRTYMDPRGFHVAPSKPISDPQRQMAVGSLENAHFPRLPDSLSVARIPCAGIADRPLKNAAPMPANPRYLLVTDMWERGGQALLSFEHVVQLCITHNLVLVLPFVRDTQIQGMPGWTQWRCVDGGTCLLCKSSLCAGAKHEHAFQSLHSKFWANSNTVFVLHGRDACTAWREALPANPSGQTIFHFLRRGMSRYATVRQGV